jgi:hypothetical protein
MLLSVFGWLSNNNAIANIRYAVRQPILKGGDDARHRLLDGRSLVLLKVGLAGQRSIVDPSVKINKAAKISYSNATLLIAI